MTVQEALILAAAIILIASLAWSNRHYAHVWRDDDPEDTV